MKRITIILFVLLIALCSCSVHPSSYEFSNPLDSVLCIELIHNRNEHGEGIDECNMESVRVLEKDDALLFMNEIYQLETERCGTPPLWGYGFYIAKVTYSNGDVEMLGSMNIEYIPNGEEPTGIGKYYFADEEIFISIFSKYAHSVKK